MLHWYIMMNDDIWDKDNNTIETVTSKKIDVPECYGVCSLCPWVMRTWECLQLNAGPGSLIANVECRVSIPNFANWLLKTGATCDLFVLEIVWFMGVQCFKLHNTQDHWTLLSMFTILDPLKMSMNDVQLLYATIVKSQHDHWLPFKFHPNFEAALPYRNREH